MNERSHSNVPLVMLAIKLDLAGLRFHISSIHESKKIWMQKIPIQEICTHPKVNKVSAYTKKQSISQIKHLQKV